MEEIVRIAARSVVWGKSQIVVGMRSFLLLLLLPGMGMWCPEPSLEEAVVADRTTRHRHRRNLEEHRSRQLSPS